METYLKTGDATRALPTGRAAAAAFRALSDPWGLSAVLYHLGWGLRQFGRYAEAVPVLEEAIEVSSRGGIQNTELWALADLGVALVNLGDLDAARARFDAAGAGSTESGDGAGHVLATYGYALLARVAGDWTQARVRYGAALAGFEELGTPVPVGLALTGLGRCDEADGLLDEARERFERARDIGDTAGEPHLVAAGLEGLARTRRRRRLAGSPGRGAGAARAGRRGPGARRAAPGPLRAGRARRSHRPARRAGVAALAGAGRTVPGKPASSRAARTSATVGSPRSTTVAVVRSACTSWTPGTSRSTAVTFRTQCRQVIPGTSSVSVLMPSPSGCRC